MIVEKRLKKVKIKEIIVVEGRDDTRAIKNAVDCQTIETHGFGISNETMSKIKKAYDSQGIIIFTDPDFAGNEIRKKLTKEFPDAKQAYISRNDAKKNTNIGVENASSDIIIDALKKVRATCVIDDEDGNHVFTKKDLIDNGLIGFADSKNKREALGKLLGIGYANANGFVNKLNGFRILKEEFDRAVEKL